MRFDCCFYDLFNRGDDYKNHLKCISEDQKYGGKGYEAKSNKGDVKQQQWIQVSADCRVTGHLFNINVHVGDIVKQNYPCVI
uniref:Zinc finger C2H2 LYAR-type domain-containing protein n=1 Tax=Anguilla anguilla TaxID=7936 RepID=A0A0E9PDH9_ANGAN